MWNESREPPIGATVRGPEVWVESWVEYQKSNVRKRLYLFGFLWLGD